MKDRQAVYYPCSICGWDSPTNKQLKENGIETSYCLMHWLRKVRDAEITTRLVKGQTKFKEEFNKAFVNVKVDGMENS